MSKKRKTPYWWAAIARARKSGRFTIADKGLAAGWVSCACGKQDAAIPRREDGSPEDETLADLGAYFCDAVDRSAISSAAELLVEIEARAAEVLAAQREAK